MGNTEYTKQYFEAYAKFSLQYHYDDCFKWIRKKECPDFQSKKYNLGLEVTRAISRDDGRIWSFINQYYGKETGGHVIKNGIDKRFKGRFRARAGTMGDTAYFSSDLDDAQIIIKTVETIHTKLKKLNHHYKVFARNYLYIFGETGLFEGEILGDIKKRVQDFDYPVKFDVIFINAIDRLFVMDFARDEIEEKKMDEESLKWCTKNAFRICAAWEKKRKK